ncbi:hypothetical protein ALC57_10491 [Trachymyrmex cornetzi]|uniref:Uncharacterized protein n=1 Tax=Trachymyrmex cornetzi TaxID=471704 RepID=A0A195DWQ9_9HYME|nr:hypothetical protein ALC57_10491 [Trachymyrmex cornetzi]
MAIAGAPTQPAGVCAPRPELKPPHYHGGPWRAAGDRGGLEETGGCAADEAAAGESVLRILEILAKNTVEKAAGSAWRGSARRESLVRYDKYVSKLFLWALRDVTTRSTFHATEDSAFASVRLMLPKTVRAAGKRSQEIGSGGGPNRNTENESYTR